MRTSKGERKKYYLDRVVHSQSETIRAKDDGWCVGRSLVRFGAKHCTTRSRWRFLERGWWNTNPALAAPYNIV